MPELVERDGKYCLEGYGDADACYDSSEEAQAARDKLKGGESKAAALEGRTIGYIQVLDGKPQPVSVVTATDMSSYAFGEHPNWIPAGYDFGKALAEQKQADEDSLLDRIWDGIKERLGWKSDGDEATGFKVAGNHWLATWSNNFEDRDGEIFTAKAIDDYVTRVDMGIVPAPELWVWHLPGTRVGQASWVDRHGHFLMAMGTFDATPQGQNARDYYQKHAGKKSLSHGFTYPADQFDGKHYRSFNTFEISLLPRGAEANLFTSLEGVKAMANVINETKKAELFAAFGEELGTRILAAEEAKGKALDELGIASKDFTQPDGEAASKQTTEQANKAFTELVPDLMEGSAEAVAAALEAVKAVKAQNATIAEMRKELDAVKETVGQRPRASQSPATVIETSHLSETMRKELDEQNTERDEFWNLDVVKTP